MNPVLFNVHVPSFSPSLRNHSACSYAVTLSLAAIELIRLFMMVHFTHLLEGNPQILICDNDLVVPSHGETYLVCNSDLISD